MAHGVIDTVMQMRLAITMQEAQDVIRSRSATLPPLQSVLELTSAAQMPQRGELTAEAQPSSAGACCLLAAQGCLASCLP